MFFCKIAARLLPWTNSPLTIVEELARLEPPVTYNLEINARMRLSSIEGWAGPYLAVQLVVYLESTLHGWHTGSPPGSGGLGTNLVTHAVSKIPSISREPKSTS